MTGKWSESEEKVIKGLTGLGFIHKYKVKKDDILRNSTGHNCSTYEWILFDVETYNSNRLTDVKITLLGSKIGTHNRIKIQFYERNYFDWFTMFEGKCNNKTELFAILKFLIIMEQLKDK